MCLVILELCTYARKLLFSGHACSVSLPSSRHSTLFSLYTKPNIANADPATANYTRRYKPQYLPFSELAAAAAVDLRASVRKRSGKTRPEQQSRNQRSFVWSMRSLQNSTQEQMKMNETNYLNISLNYLHVIAYSHILFLPQNTECYSRWKC